MTSAFLNGKPATADDLRALALANYGHFTSMQVRDGAVQGRALHRQRLEEATFILFGTPLDGDDALKQAAQAMERAGLRDASVRITVFSTRFDYRDPARVVAPDVLVTLSPAASGDKPVLRVKSYPFVRPLPQVKHVGTFPLFHYRRQALADGYDDALFVDPAGQVVEGRSGTWACGTASRSSGPRGRRCGVRRSDCSRGRWKRQGPAAARHGQAGRTEGLPGRIRLQCQWFAGGGGGRCRRMGADIALMARLRAALDPVPWTPVG